MSYAKCDTCKLGMVPITTACDGCGKILFRFWVAFVSRILCALFQRNWNLQ